MNSDGSYDAKDSGGFGKDYHGQDAFGERIGGTGIGGSHFGGKAAGDFSDSDELGEGHFTERYTDYGQVAQTEVPDTSAFESEEASSDMRDILRDLNSESSEENSNVGSMDTGFQIGGIEDEDKEKYQQELDRAEENLAQAKERISGLRSVFAEVRSSTDAAIAQLDKRSIRDRFANAIGNMDDQVLDTLENLSKTVNYNNFDRNKVKEAYKEKGTDALRNTMSEILESAYASAVKDVKDALDKRNYFKGIVDSYKSSTTDKTKTSFTDKMKPSTAVKTTEAKPGPNMSKASVGKSDYNTKANKDSKKEQADLRNDFGNHAADTLKGVVDKIADNTTAKALGIQALEDFAKEKGVDPNKISTMKAYQSYQIKRIMKAIPNLMKKAGSYITERIKDAFDPSQLPERIRNTLARYNAATLVGAAILSIQSGAGIQASIDQALTMVDPEDQPAVSDYLEDVLSDEGTVADLSNAFDDALAPEQTSDTAELDESIVNIGRKDNTDYSGFNAGLGTTSDADVKVFIARNVKADPILRRMISKMGK